MAHVGNVLDISTSPNPASERLNECTPELLEGNVAVVCYLIDSWNVTSKRIVKHLYPPEIHTEEHGTLLFDS